MAKTSLTFTSKELMQIVYDHAIKNKLIPNGTYDGGCSVRPTGRHGMDGFDFTLHLKKVD